MIWAITHCLPSLPGRELSEGRALSILFTIIFPLRGTEPAPGRSTAASAGRMNTWILPDACRTCVRLRYPPFP